ncbi:MAG: hypothetical protein V1760_03030 [Candidatus Peregrinibacteria bacterium]
MPNPFQQYQDHIVDPATQQRLNEPLVKEEGLDQKEETFLQSLVRHLESGKLHPLKPETLFNHAVYDKLSETEQEATDLTAINLMSVLKRIQILWDSTHRDSYQLQNLVDTVFAMKSKFEEKYGDVFII